VIRSRALVIRPGKVLAPQSETDDLRRSLQMIAGGEDVFEGAAALGQQLAKDPGDATRPATARIGSA